ncbi:hypothetical protein GOP47_0010093 [Adiantum capillus-veneris]|uniref:Uncharacterized protein n=1 Tax=Adiantum capillus-veneris TaxID=13818 RepID=A0A9D4UUH6_ADICA|nr:hypothetical protein GOP47_0010093 [Adiantum capillus-veneris]
MLVRKAEHRRHFSSGIRPILRALAEIRDKEEINAVSKLLKKTAQPSSEKRTSNEPENLPLVVKAELERRKPNPPKKKDSLPPVPFWKTRRAWACMKGCGACCYLEKGPQYPPVEEVLANPEEAAVSLKVASVLSHLQYLYLLLW